MEGDVPNRAEDAYRPLVAGFGLSLEPLAVDRHEGELGGHVERLGHDQEHDDEEAQGGVHAPSIMTE